MLRRTLLLPLCIATLLTAADQVVLKNGDTVTGGVVRKDGDKLVFHSDIMGEVTIPWSAVKSLHTDQELVVVLPNGEQVKGKLSTSGETLEVAAATPKSAPMAAVAAMRNEAEQHLWERIQHPRIVQQWTGSYALGLALTRGNARTLNLTNNFVATRTTLHDKLGVHFNQIFASALVDNVNSATARAMRGGWFYNHGIGKRAFIAFDNDYEHDRFQDLDLRAVFGMGMGWNVVKGDTTILSVQAGGDYERESFTDATHRNSMEVAFGNDFLHRFSKVTSVTQSFRMFPNMNERGQYRLNFDLSGVTALKRWLGWTMTFSDRFISNPVGGRLRNDVLLATGFRLTFSQ